MIRIASASSDFQRRASRRRTEHAFRSRLDDAIDAADDVSLPSGFAVICIPAISRSQNRTLRRCGHPSDGEDAAVIHRASRRRSPFTSKIPPSTIRAEKREGARPEMHLYARGGHGYGLRRTELPVTRWPNWSNLSLIRIEVLKAPPSAR